MPKNGKIQYRKVNFIAKDNREITGAAVSPALLEGLKKIAKAEHKTVSWVIETALADYFGIEVELKKCKRNPKPAYPFRG